MTSLLSMPELRPTDVQLRDYQQQAIDAVRAEFARGRRSTLIVCATGVGKSVILGSIARRVAERGGRTLILAHRGELIEQLTETLTRLGLDPGIEKAGQHARAIYEPNAVVATVQTMQRERLMSWPRDYFRLIVTDECHHSVADTYRNIYKHFDAIHLGCTATVDRADEENLGDIYESVAFEYSMWDAMTAPAPGPYLSRLRFVQCDVGIDLRQIRTTNSSDLNAADLEEAIRPHIETLANAIKQEAGTSKTLIFTPDVGSSMAMASALVSIGLTAKWVAGDSPDRKDVINGFRRSDFQVLVNCQLATEGFDVPDIEAVVLCRPTKSRSLYAQMVGRGTRLAPGKQFCKLIDFNWLTEKHKLVQPVELFATTSTDGETLEIAAEMVKKQKGLDLKDVIEDAAEEKRRRTVLRIKAQERQVRYRKVSYDPLSAMETLGVTLRREAVSNQGTITDGQRACLERWGFTDLDSCSKRRASQIIDVYGDRLRKGLATHRQVSALIRDGMDPAEARAMTKAEASAKLATILGDKVRPGFAPKAASSDEEPTTWVA